MQRGVCGQSQGYWGPSARGAVWRGGGRAPLGSIEREGGLAKSRAAIGRTQVEKHAHSLGAGCGLRLRLRLRVLIRPYSGPARGGPRSCASQQQLEREPAELNNSTSV